LIYDRALIAMGAEPNRLPIPGLDLPGVQLLRTLDDSMAIRREIERGAQRALIVGGGYIGVEVSADCLQKGVAVTLLQRGRQLWGRFAARMSPAFSRICCAPNGRICGLVKKRRR
jgi:NADPH-dependent 2,4-dienoyl-CoA reductase/sulfur reductase-like enzyme